MAAGKGLGGWVWEECSLVLLNGKLPPRRYWRGLVEIPEVGGGGGQGGGTGTVYRHQKDLPSPMPFFFSSSITNCLGRVEGCSCVCVWVGG